MRAIMKPNPSPPPLSAATGDTELAALAAQGDVHAFETIMRRHNRLLYRTARSILRDDADSEDALQEAYLRAWRGIGRFRADARLSTWLVRIVINESLGRLRRRGADVIPLEGRMHAGDDVLEVHVEDEPGARPERAAMRAELRRLIEAHIDRLPDAFRSVFVLRGVEELGVDEVATLLGIPEATVRTRFFRARGLLREALSRDVDLAIGDAFAFDGARCDRIVAGVLEKLVDPEPVPGG
jgi:RNA polymerase sigma-70 factor (ECF subfamily)